MKQETKASEKKIPVLFFRIRIKPPYDWGWLAEEGRVAAVKETNKSENGSNRQGERDREIERRESREG